MLHTIYNYIIEKYFRVNQRQDIFLEAMYPVQKKDKNYLLDYNALARPDTMYMHEATKETDRK